MYFRADHVEPDLSVLRQLIRDNPLGLITTAVKSDTHPFLQASHIPFVLDSPPDSTPDKPGRLRAHIARQNPQSKAMIDELNAGPGSGGVLEHDVMVVFTAQHHHYITPKFYVETKPATGKVVPTWDYAAAQAYGKARIYYDSKAEETIEFLNTQMADLTRQSEGGIMGYTGKEGRPTPWEVTDAPERHIEMLRTNIIGIEIEIEKLEGKFKMSQEMRKGDRDGVVAGLQGLESETAREVGKVVKQRGEVKDAARAAA